MDLDGVTRSLPPLVEGKVHGYLKLIINEVVWYRLRPGDVTVLASWWGETDNAQFRPVDPTMTYKRPESETRETYAIRTNLELFSEYLTNCGSIDLTIISETLNEVVGTAEVTDLHEIFHRQRYTHYCSIFNKVGTKIGDIPVTMSLTMLQKAQRSPSKLKKAKMSKTNFNLSDPDLHLSVKKLESEKFVPRSARQLNKREESVYRSILKDKRFKMNEKPSNITDNLVAQVVARAKKLRGELLKADGENTVEFNENSVNDLENEEEEAALYKYFMGGNLTKRDERRALKKLRDTSPTPSLIDMATETIESCRETENFEQNSQKNRNFSSKNSNVTRNFSTTNEKSDHFFSVKNEKSDRSVTLKNNDFSENEVSDHLQLHEKPSTPMDHVDSLKIFVSTLTLTPAGYRRVKSSCLSRSDGVSTSVTYFLQYDAGFANVKKYNKKVINQSKKRVKITSRKQDGEVIHFNHEAVYDLPRSHLHILLTSPWKFKIFHRHFDQRTPTELGVGSVSIGEAAKSKFLTSTQKLAVVNKGIKIGELQVTLELGCDRIHFGRQFIEAVTMAKENIPVLELSNDFSVKNRQKSAQNNENTTSGRNYSSITDQRPYYSSRSNEVSQKLHSTREISRKSVEKIGFSDDETSKYRETSRKSVEKIDFSDFSNEKILLHGLIHISQGRHLSSSDTYIVCRALWKQNRTSSKVCYNTTNPAYNLHQIIPLIYGPELLERTQDNCIITEVYSKNPAGEDDLLGIAKLSVHELYMAFKEPEVVGTLLRARFPVLSVDGWVPVTNPVNGRLCGEISAIVALGTADQIALFEMTRGLKARNEENCFLNEKPIHDREEPISLREHSIYAQKELISQRDHPIYTEKQTISREHPNSHKKEPIFQGHNSVYRQRQALYSQTEPIYEEDLTSDEEEPILQGRNTTFHLDEPISPGKTTIYREKTPIYRNPLKTQECQTEISTFANPIQKSALDSSEDLHTDLHPTSDRLSTLATSSIIQNPQTSIHIAEIHKEDDEEIGTTAVLSSNSHSFSEDSDQSRENFQISRGMYRSVGVGAEFSEPEPRTPQNTDYNPNPEPIPTSTSPKPEKSASESDPPPEVQIVKKPEAEEDSEDGFRVVIEIECALHLPTIDLPDAPVEPSTYVTFQNLSGTEKTEVFPYSCNPKYDFRCDTKLPTDLLTNDRMRLIMKVWRLLDPETSTAINSEKDVVIGFSAIDLTVLTAGFPVISGWFNINDFAGKSNGQLKVSVTPLDNISGFSRVVGASSRLPGQIPPEDHSNFSSPYPQDLERINGKEGPSAPPEVGEDPREVVGTSADVGFDFGLGLGDASMSFLSLSLKQKLTELDEIKQRLQSRLQDVTSNAFEEDFDNDFDFLEGEFEDNDGNGNVETEEAEHPKSPEVPVSNRITNGNGEVIGEIEPNRPMSDNNTNSPELNLTDTGYSSGSNLHSATNGHKTGGSPAISHQNPVSPSNGGYVDQNYPPRGTRMHISHLLDKLSMQLTTAPAPIANLPMQRNIMDLISTLRRNNNNFSNDIKCNRQANVRTVPTQTETHLSGSQTHNSETKRNKSNEDYKDEIPAKTQKREKISTIVREELIAEDLNDSSEYDDLSAHLMTANVRHMGGGDAMNPLFYRHAIPDVTSVPESTSPSLTPEDDAIQRLDTRYSESFSATINKSLGRLKTFLEGEPSRLSPSESSELFRGSLSGIPENTDGNIDVTVIHKPCNDDVMASNSVDSTTVSVDMQSGTEVEDNSSLVSEPSVSGVSRQAPEGGNPAEDPGRPLLRKSGEQSDDSSTRS